MKLNTRFKQFHTNISLNAERKKRIRSAYSNLKSFIESDDLLSAIEKDLFQQGSFASGTAVKPIKDGEEFDIDVVLALAIEERPEDKRTPKDLVAWVADRLRTHRDYKGKVKQKNRCVRIDYAGDFHLDIVPAWWLGDDSKPILVPDRDSDEWIPSHPKGYIDWVECVDSRANDKFCRIVKMLKHWRNLKMGKATAPSSIIFTTLIGDQMHEWAKSYASDAEVLVIVMEALDRYLQGCANKPVVSNPSMPQEDLAALWEEDHFRVFRDKFHPATEKARAALDEGDKEESIKLWQSLFGDKYFPKSTKHEAAQMADAISSGQAYATQSGRMVIGKPDLATSILIPEHRSFGD